MKLHQLRSLVAVIEQASVSAAARELALTPSSVSAHIKALESEFGIVLIERSRGESAQIIEQLGDHKADMGIVYGQVDAVELRAHKLGRTELVVALPAGWLSAGEDAIDANSQRPWIQTGADCPFQMLSRQFFAARKIDPPVEMRVDDDRTRRQLVIAGMGVSLLDRHEADHPAIAVLPGAALRCDLTLVFQAHRQFEPLIKTARDLILLAA